MFPLNYIGSKRTLFPFIRDIIRKHLPSKGIVGDLFAGTGVVGQSLAKEDGYTVVANDIQYYSYVLNRAALAVYSLEEEKLISELISEYNQPLTTASKGFISKNYAPPERMYFTQENADRIDHIRLSLESRRKTIGEKVYFYLVASLISAADKVANVSCVYGAFLKKFKKTATIPLTLRPFAGVLEKPSEDQTDSSTLVADLEKLTVETKTAIKGLHKAHLGNADQIRATLDLAYLDPPYNQRQYYTNYHLLETIARYDNPAIHGKTGLRNDESQKSLYCYKATALDALRKLVAGLDTPIIVLSYNNEGIIPRASLVEFLKSAGKVTGYRKAYKKFKAQDGVTDTEVYEYLYVLEKSSQHNQSAI